MRRHTTQPALQAGRFPHGPWCTAASRCRQRRWPGAPWAPPQECRPPAPWPGRLFHVSPPPAPTRARSARWREGGSRGTTAGVLVFISRTGKPKIPRSCTTFSRSRSVVLAASPAALGCSRAALAAGGGQQLCGLLHPTPRGLCTPGLSGGAQWATHASSIATKGPATHAAVSTSPSASPSARSTPGAAGCVNHLCWRPAA